MVKTKTDKPVRLADILLAGGQKKFGKDSASMRGLSEIKDYIDTRCFALNTAIGRPGIPTGRLTVIQGKESSGKTTIAVQTMAECQSRGGVTIYLECESAFEADRAAALGLYNEEWVEKLGLNVEPLIILRPQHIIEAFAMIEYYVKAVRAVDADKLLCIVWDSVAATPTTAEAKEDNDDYTSIQPGLAARQVSMGFRRINSLINDNQVALICLNFIKEKINSGFGGFGDNTATIAQKPLGQHASVRIQLVQVGTVGEKKSKSSGIKVLAKINKNKIAPPHREVEFSIIYATGMDNDGSMLDMAKSLNIVKASGGFIVYGEEKFRRSQWPDVTCHDEVVTKLKAKVAAAQTDAVTGWKPDDEQDDDDDYRPPPKNARVGDDDDD